jgi:hypothetical protein
MAIVGSVVSVATNTHGGLVMNVTQKYGRLRIGPDSRSDLLAIQKLNDFSKRVPNASDVFMADDSLFDAREVTAKGGQRPQR